MYGARLDIGQLGVWTSQFDQRPLKEVVRAAQELDELGYGALWFGETFGREGLSQAATLLSATTRMAMASGVLNIYGRDPVTMAQAHRTLVESYGSRFVLGLGISHPWLVTELRGLTFGPRVATMRSYLDRMDAAPVGPPGADKQGARVLGAVGWRMLELASERASGALPMGMPIEHTARTRTLLGPDAFLGVILPVLVGPDGARSREAARQYVAESLPNRAGILRSLGYTTDLNDPASDRLISALVAWGDRDTIAERVREHHRAGADQVCLYVIGTQQDDLPLREWRELAGLAD
jgi:probable F420-dependent oxidoreductase